MDRPLADTQIKRNRRRPWWSLLLGVLFIGGVFWGLRQWLRPQAMLDELRIATLEKGPLESTIAAAGRVVPAFEQQLNAPVATDIKSVLLRNGAEVNPGDLILELNPEFIELDLAARKGQLALRENSIELLQLELERDLRELEYDDQIKALEVEAARARLTDVQRLLEVGGATAEEVEQASTHLRMLQLEKQKLENELQYRRRSLQGRQRAVELEAEVASQEVQELARKLKLTSVRAPGKGVITWVNERIGEQVAEGSPLVRIADLRSFQIEGSCSDRYADRIQLGQLVRIRLGDKVLDGDISQILPAVENNTVAFRVRLQQADDPGLRPNQQLELSIVTARKQQVLRVRQGPAFRGARRQTVFVVEGEQAIKHEVEVGISNGEFVEIIDAQLKPGDRIVISDMRDYEHLSQLQLE